MYQTHYSVVASCPTGEIASDYLDWLVDGGHLEALLDAGAMTAEAVRLDPIPNATATPIRIMSVYTFASRADLDRYLHDHAPRLRAEGLAKFGDSGITFQRETGEIVRLCDKAHT